MGFDGAYKTWTDYNHCFQKHPDARPVTGGGYSKFLMSAHRANANKTLCDHKAVHGQIESSRNWDGYQDADDHSL